MNRGGSGLHRWATASEPRRFHMAGVWPAMIARPAVDSLSAHLFLLAGQTQQYAPNEIGLIEVGVKLTERVVAAIEREVKKDLFSVGFWRGDCKCDKDYKEAGNM